MFYAGHIAPRPRRRRWRRSREARVKSDCGERDGHTPTEKEWCEATPTKAFFWGPSTLGRQRG
jgi:hypothetical protein